MYAQASCDETSNHLHCIAEIHHKKDEMKTLLEEYDVLGKQVNKFIAYVDKNWNTK